MQNQATAPAGVNVNDDSATQTEARKPVSKKIQQSDMERAFADLLDHNHTLLPSAWPRFPHTFFVLKDRSGSHQYVELQPNQVLCTISKQRMVDELTSFCRKNLISFQGFDIPNKAFSEFVQFWANSSPSFPHTITPVLLKSDEGYCWHKLPFDLTEGEYPVWKELLERMTNRDAFMAWVYSLLEPKSDRQTYVWIYGAGRNGKGSIGRAMKKLLGPSCKGERVPAPDNKHWTHGLLGKRLVVFGDCSNYSFPTSGLFKSVTGDDELVIEGKYKDNFSTYLSCKFMFNSNEKPLLSSSKADMRRAIYCELGETTEEYGSNYEQHLWEEMPYFIHACAATYRAMVPQHEPIKVDKNAADLVISSAEELFEVIWERNFRRAGDANFVTSAKLLDVLAREGVVKTLEINHFKAWMKRAHGVEDRRFTINGIRSTRYLGMTATVPQGARGVP